MSLATGHQPNKCPHLCSSARLPRQKPNQHSGLESKTGFELQTIWFQDLLISEKVLQAKYCNGQTCLNANLDDDEVMNLLSNKKVCEPPCRPKEVEECDPRLSGRHNCSPKCHKINLIKGPHHFSPSCYTSGSLPHSFS